MNTWTEGKDYTRIHKPEACMRCDRPAVAYLRGMVQGTLYPYCEAHYESARLAYRSSR